MDYQRVLNAEQLRVVTAPDGPCVVLAAAGTGKTRVIVYRVAWLIEHGIPPERILLLTFTNRAAAEMLRRTQDTVGASVGGIWAGTFHHFANRILRQQAPAIGYPQDYLILDRDDAEAFVRRLVAPHHREDATFPALHLLLRLFSEAINTEKPLETILQARLPLPTVDAAAILRLQEQYTRHKYEQGCMDFDDLILQVARLFREHPTILRRYQEQFLHILVDEYQDTNRLQAEIVDQLSARTGNVMVVGDDFQSIYSWRGADFRNLLTFSERHPGARTHRLETNYRSVPEILAVANACIAHNPGQAQKTLRSVRESYRKPVVPRVRDGADQARYVAYRILALRREGYSYSDVAILYRAHHHAMEMELELRRQGIPYWVTSGLRFFEQVHIKDVCSILQVAIRPTDLLAFERLLTLLPGVGLKTVARIWPTLGHRFDAADATARTILRNQLRPSTRKSWDAVEPILVSCRTAGMDVHPGEVLARFTDAFYASYAMAHFDNAPERLDDIQALIAYTTHFANAEAFLSDVALLTNLDAEEEPLRHPQHDSVRLSTVHQAKGLEWPVVFVLWLADGMFPSGRTLMETPGGEAEERRLFYVAVTRAKDELFLCAPQTRQNRDGVPMPCLPSRFLTELPPELFHAEHPGWV